MSRAAFLRRAGRRRLVLALLLAASLEAGVAMALALAGGLFDLGSESDDRPVWIDLGSQGEAGATVGGPAVGDPKAVGSGTKAKAIPEAAQPGPVRASAAGDRALAATKPTTAPMSAARATTARSPTDAGASTTPLPAAARDAIDDAPSASAASIVAAATGNRAAPATAASAAANPQAPPSASARDAAGGAAASGVGDAKAGAATTAAGSTAAARAGAGAVGGAGEGAAERIASELVAFIETHKTYPEAARRRGLEGKAVIAFRVRADGILDWARVDSSSGSAILDSTALGLVKSAFPIAFSGDRSVELRLPIDFRLSSAVAP